jgi:hypothetical protein
MRAKRSILFLSLFFLAGIVSAHPVPYQGSLSIMTWNQPFFNETMTTYSFHRKAAVAAQYMRMDMDDGEMKLGTGQLNYLVKRWNALESQANVYLSGGGGVYDFDEHRQAAGYGAFEADYETRKVYVSGKFSGIFPDSDKNTLVSIYRAGVSVYPAEFDELSSWLILDVQHNTRLKHSVTVTPVLRLFYKNVLSEIGSSFNGDWMLNFMIHL